MDQDTKTPLGYGSADELMAHGPHALHEYVASKLEIALGRALPQMEVRFKDLSITADVKVTEDKSPKGELPTLANTMKKALGSCSSKKKVHVVKKEILKGLSGRFEPASVTLVLGQPGSGKSSLMKILSGRFPMEKNITLSGDITYNGEQRENLIKRLPQFVAYVTQRDKHYPTLTVKETLEFAHAMSGGEFTKRGKELLSKGTPEENQAALDAAKAMFQHYPDIIIQQLGLQNCQDTVVGNNMLRGVSGGERKRVTTGEMEFGMRYVTLMDEISTGLDSAATYDIINTQRSIAKTFRKTVIIALLQPSPEVFALFDNVMILNQGQVMYHGPREQVVEYFESLGFVCPPERDIADFLLDLGTKQQYRYQVPLAIEGNKHARHPSEFAQRFQQSQIHAEMLSHVDGPVASDLRENVKAHMDPMPEFHQSFLENTRTLMKRQGLVTIRNTAFLKGRAIMVIVMGLLYGSTFYQFNPTNVQIVIGTLFQSILFLALGQASQIPTYMNAREIFYKQRASNFLRTSSYVMSNSVSQVPLAIAESITFGSMVYWMCGFESDVQTFVIYMITLVLTNLAFASWFFVLANVAPDMHMAKPMAMLSVVFFVMFAGFVIPKGELPDYVIWLYWLNPIAWGLRALAVNQYKSDPFDQCLYDGVNYCTSTGGLKMGEYYLSLFDVPTDKYWIWFGMMFMIVSYLLFMTLGWAVLEYKRYESPEHVMLTKSDTDADPQSNGYALLATPKGATSGPAQENIVMLEMRNSSERNFVPVTIAFQDLWYTVPLPSDPKQSLDLLKGISGYALPGSMTALMGSSGAGKTTLMDVIAGRKTGGKIQGKILLNGYEANDLAIRRCTGYCEQMDIHSEGSTIREALTFSAFLRQDSSVPDAKKHDSVLECLDLLDMHDIADQIIRGSSVEQMKRLTIGVELAAQPSVIFLDEPTSGLDARSAKLIMDGVRKVANTGRTIVCTIHQPSAEVFYLFDNLLLLKRGGETVYFGDLGEDCRELITYFESVPGTTPLLPGYNPAAWMLECIGAGVDNSAANDMDFVHIFQQSEKKMLMDSAMQQEGVTVPSSKMQQMIYTKKRAASSWTQCRFLVRRSLDLYWRTASYNITRIFVSLVLALIFGIVFAQVTYTTYQGINSGIGVVFSAMLFTSLVSFNSVLPIASDDRAAFYRERASQTYNALWYFVGTTVAEIPYVFASGLVFTIVFYPMVGFTGFSAGVMYWITASLMILLSTYMGQFLVYALPSIEVAAIIGVLMNSIFFLFMGFNPPTATIPSGYKWIYHITPHTYAAKVLAALVFSDCSTNPEFNAATGTWSDVGSDLACQPVTGLPVTMGNMIVKTYVEVVFNIKHSELWKSFAALLGFIVLFRLFGLLALRFVNHQKR